MADEPTAGARTLSLPQCGELPIKPSLSHGSGGESWRLSFNPKARAVVLPFALSMLFSLSTSSYTAADTTLIPSPRAIQTSLFLVLLLLLLLLQVLALTSYSSLYHTIPFRTLPTHCVSPACTAAASCKQAHSTLVSAAAHHSTFAQLIPSAY